MFIHLGGKAVIRQQHWTLREGILAFVQDVLGNRQNGQEGLESSSQLADIWQLMEHF